MTAYVEVTWITRNLLLSLSYYSTANVTVPFACIFWGLKNDIRFLCGNPSSSFQTTGTFFSFPLVCNRWNFSFFDLSTKWQKKDNRLLRVNIMKLRVATLHKIRRRSQVGLQKIIKHANHFFSVTSILCFCHCMPLSSSSLHASTILFISLYISPLKEICR